MCEYRLDKHQGALEAHISHKSVLVTANIENYLRATRCCGCVRQEMRNYAGFSNACSSSGVLMLLNA